jgi:hydroxyacylglutathione hydrolase
LEAIDMITPFRSALYMTQAAVVETPDLIVIVDPCWLPDEVASIHQYVAALAADKPRYLLFTHSDFDHIIGYGAFAHESVNASVQACSAVQVISSQRMADKSASEQEAILEQIREFDDRYYIERDYPIMYPSVTIPVAQNGQQLAVGGTTLTFYLAPGHTDDGLMTIVEHICDSSNESIGVLIAGDYLSDVEFPYIYHSSEAYLNTLVQATRILEQHTITMLLPGHGNITCDHVEMRSRISNSEQYIHALRAEAAQNMNTANNEQWEEFLVNSRFPRHMRHYHEENQSLVAREQHPSRS